jgi:hypothetical protein
MKNLKNTILILLISTSLFYACVEDENYTIPQIENEENNSLNRILDSIKVSSDWTLISITDLKNQFNSGSDAFQINSNQVVKGYVVSSDLKGNFFREFYLQDHPTKPTSAIKVVLNLSNTYNKFNIGREVYIHLKDLYIGETKLGDGVTSIGGKLEENEVDLLTLNQIDTHILRSNNTEIVEPLSLTFSGINQQHIGLYVKIDNVHFTSDLNGKPYVDAIDDFDTQRILTSCQGFDFTNFILETSTFAQFKNEILPSGGGSISGIISKTYNGDNFVLAINNTADIDFYGTKCEVLNIIDFSTILLYQDFESTSGAIAIPGWTNYIEEGTKNWRSYVDNDSFSRAARIGSFRSGNVKTTSWLITEEINLETTSQEFLSFETSNSFADGSDLEVLISTDWDGETASISTAKWNLLPAIIVKDNDAFDQWFHSSYIDLSNYSGIAHIAFKYIGNGNESFDGTFELDTIIINAK